MYIDNKYNFYCTFEFYLCLNSVIQYSILKDIDISI